MSIKKFFRDKGTTPKKQRSVKDFVSESDQAESVDYLTNYEQLRESYLPPVDYNNPENISRFASAQKAYATAVIKVYEEYPYDGTLAEKVNWEFMNSFLERHVFENEYPRNTGHIRLSAAGWTKNANAALSTSLYGMPTSVEYIEIRGGPHTSLSSNIQSQSQHQFGRLKGDNTYTWDFASNDWMTMRKSNLYASGTSGNTIEFWFKRDTGTYHATNKTKREVIFDMWNKLTELTVDSETFPDGDYGRIRLEYSEESNKPLFYFTYIGPSKNTDSTTDPGVSRGVVDVPLDYVNSRALTFYDTWRHIAVSVENNGADLDIYFHIDGAIAETRKAIGQAVATIPAPHIANIGALVAQHELEYDHWSLTLVPALACNSPSGRHGLVVTLVQKEDNNTPGISRRPLIVPAQKRDNSAGFLNDAGTALRKTVDANALYYILKVYVKNIPGSENLEFGAANQDGTLGAADADGWQLMTNRTLEGVNTPESFVTTYANVAYPLGRLPNGEFKFVAEIKNSIVTIATVEQTVTLACP